MVKRDIGKQAQSKNRSDDSQGARGGRQQQQSLTSSQVGRQRGLARRENVSPALWMNDPFQSFSRLAEEMERIFEDFGVARPRGVGGLGSGLLPMSSARGMSAPVNAWLPQIDILEREGRMIVRADLPGLTADDVVVEIGDGVLTIAGERGAAHDEHGEGWYRCERSHGTFLRSVPLPEGIDPEQAQARFENGVLEIAVPLPQGARENRRIPIQGKGGRERSSDSGSGSEDSGRETRGQPRDDE